MPQPALQATAENLLNEVLAELEPVERALRTHPFPTLLAKGRVPRERLIDFATEQVNIVASDRRSFAQMAARYTPPPAGDLFLQLAVGEELALSHLWGFARWLGQEPDDLEQREPSPGGQAYSAFVAWLALNGSTADIALAFLANLAAWGENCRRVAVALREQYGANSEATGFFDFFATPAPGFRDEALTVVGAGLAAGEPPVRARRAARLLQQYELMFWDRMMDGLE